MYISKLIQKWSGIDKTSKIFIIVDDVQRYIADSIKEEKVFDVQVENFSKNEEINMNTNRNLVAPCLKQSQQEQSKNL